LSPFGAIMIGAASGLVSCFGFNKIMLFLEDTIGLHDTCGVHNLHAMPSVIGALASVILAGYKGTLGRTHDTAVYGVDTDSQWWRQWVSILLCISFALTAGTITGMIMNLCYQRPEDAESRQFHDNEYWTVADDYGRSLYSELASILKTEENGVVTDVKEEVIAALPETWGSHSGRRKAPESVPDNTISKVVIKEAVADLNSSHSGRRKVPAGKVPVPAPMGAMPTSFAGTAAIPKSNPVHTKIEEEDAADIELANKARNQLDD